MNDPKGTINYLRSIRKMCLDAESCIFCPLDQSDDCLYKTIPILWSDEKIVKSIDAVRKAMKEGE